MYPYQLKELRRDFFDECDSVIRIPGVIFLEDSFGKRISKLMPIPLYEYVGIIENNGSFELEVKQVKNNVHIGLQEIEPGDIEKLERWRKESTKESILIFEELPILKKINLSEETYERIKNSKLKIWSEIPSSTFAVSCPLNTALTVILYCMDRKIPFLEFNQLKEKYKSCIRGNKFRSDILNPPQKLDRDCKRAIETIREIFLFSCLIDAIHLPSLIFCSLFGTTSVKPETIKCEFPIPQKIYEEQGHPKDNFSGFLSFFAYKDHLKVFYSYLKDCLKNNTIKISLETETFEREKREIALVHWEGGEDLLGPILAPFYSGGFDYNKEFQSKIRVEGTHKYSFDPNQKETSFRISYEDNVLEFIGPHNLIWKALQNIKESGKGWVYYYSNMMRWEADGIKFLEPEEYKLSEPPKGEVVSEKPLESKEEKPKYEIWQPDSHREGWPIYQDNITYSELKNKYLGDISRYEIFVDETKGQTFLKGLEAKEELKPGKIVPSIRGKPFGILCRFLRKGGIAGSVEQIFTDVWGDEPELFDKFENRIERAMGTLREKLKDISLGIEFSNGRYRFSRFVNYCLIKEKEIP